MKSEKLPSRRVVLLGVGHTNAHIVRMWRMQAYPDTELICVSDRSVATYSGMLPAVLAGQKQPDEMQIDLVRLCASVGARLVVDEVVGLCHESHTLKLKNRPSLSYDVLSVGIGSVPDVKSTQVAGDALLLIKPMQDFLLRLERRLEAINSTRVVSQDSPLRVAIVGSGVAGVEILFCLPPWLLQSGVSDFELTLVTRSDEILDNESEGLRRKVLEECRRRGHAVHVGQAVASVDRDGIELADASRIEADLVIWATGATAPPLLSQLGLPIDEKGFLLTDDCLQTTAGYPVFAVGDSGTIRGVDYPKAGVYAVRQGPILWQNLKRQLANLPLHSYRPQQSFLKLLNLGDGRAIGQYGKLSFRGKWVYQLKDRIDSKFMDKFDPVTMSGAEEMQCRGCGCKLGADTLQRAIAADAGSVQLDDAAPIGIEDSSLIGSTDFFSNPFDDAYLFGRIAALHAASDVLACGGEVLQALANVVLPEGDSDSQHETLAEFLEGARLELQRLGGNLVGGHTIVGPRFEAGFTVIGKHGGQVLRKGALQSGDQLYLTKPIGTGVLLAAHMRSLCRAGEYERLVACMLDSSLAWARAATCSGLTAATDITGFGLAGHLLEMLSASDLTATIHLAKVPFLPGAIEASAAGITSSLFSDNVQANRQMTATDSVQQRPDYSLLFDPQTCGGLLIGVPPEHVEAFLASGLEQRQQNGETQTPPVRIGQVGPHPSGSATQRRLNVVE